MLSPCAAARQVLGRAGRGQRWLRAGKPVPLIDAALLPSDTGTGDMLHAFPPPALPLGMCCAAPPPALPLGMCCTAPPLHCHWGCQWRCEAAMWHLTTAELLDPLMSVQLPGGGEAGKWFGGGNTDWLADQLED